MAASLNWFIGTFDISSEFAGNNHERRYEGTPPKPRHEAKKRNFNLHEAPRLEWLRARSVVLAAGFEEIESCPAVFVLFSELRICGKRAMIGMLILHVDDGLWAGQGPLYAAAKDKIRKEFNLHERNGTFKFLGRKVIQTSDFSITLSQHDYVKEISPIYLEPSRCKKYSLPATTDEITAFRNMITQLAWPARNTLPQIVFDISDMQQRSADVTIGTLVRANRVLRRAQQLVNANTYLKFNSDVDLNDSVIALTTGTAFGTQPGGGSQCGFTITWGPSSMTREQGHQGQRSTLLDWCSMKIRPTVDSSLEAEVRGCCTGYDRAVHIRSIITEMLGTQGDTWKERVMQLPQISLVDSCTLHKYLLIDPKTIRANNFDDADIREWLNRGDKLFWIPTLYFLVDPLTRHYPYTPILDNYMIHYRYNFADQFRTPKRGAEDVPVPADPMEIADIDDRWQDTDGPWQ
jgi:hypothetical protein